MYINFWYPIARSTEITADKPLSVRLMGLHFVAFRDDKGQARGHLRAPWRVTQ